MENEARNFIKAWLKVIASLCYSYFIASKLPKGKFRFFSLLPIFYIFTILPLSLSRPIPSIILSGYFSWLANFKLLLYSFNLGPLSTNYPQSSFPKFFLLAAFPIAIIERSDVHSLTFNIGVQNTSIEKDSTTKKVVVVVPLNFWSKVVLFVLLEFVYNSMTNMFVLFGLMYLSIDISFGICDLIVRATLGVELKPPSNEPYLSTSLQDFWGKRWNCMISDILRHAIYRPTRSTVEKLIGSKWAPLPAILASFVISGLMHELAYYHMTRVNPTWEVTWFFVLHGVCVILEVLVKRRLGQKWRLHWAVSGPLTVGFVMVTGIWLFFPQIMRNNVHIKATEDILSFWNYVNSKRDD